MRRELSSLTRLFFAGLFLLAPVTVALGGCGARGPLDADDLATNVTADAGTDPSNSASGDAGPDAPTSSPGTEPPDAGHDASVLQCGACVATSCGSKILACVQSAGCRAAVQCVVTKCLKGSVDPVCLFGCGGSDPSAALAALDIFQCVTGSCGGDCSSVLGRLGGLGGGKALPETRQSLEEVLSP
jgi:hypothetical protein